uniref:Mitochondrial fission process protein 1 n=1 Tax=Xenopsylla cheopis TaxID=163159 RepID=A0A6M2DH81_XENCH
MQVKISRNKTIMDNPNDKDTKNEMAPQPILISPEKVQAKEHDVYRDTYIRYLGYANEIGEAFRPLVHRSVVMGSYGISSAYVLADTWDKALKAYNKPGSRSRDILISAADTLLWQGFASVIIPGYTINRITYFTSKFVQKGKMAQFVPTAVGLLSIPFIIKPIDHAVDLTMNYTFRKVF